MVDRNTRDRLIRVAGILEGCIFFTQEDGVASACERALEIIDEILDEEEKNDEER